MTDFLPHPNAGGLVKLSGTIRNLKVTRGTASFVFTESDQSRMGVIAVAVAMGDMGGQAIATASNASAMEEEADYLEFDLDGKQVKGWVWRNPFNDGDAVEVAAEDTGLHWEVFGVTRPNDKIIALYPHCSRSQRRHYRNSFKWWFYGGFGSIAFIGFPVFYIIAGDCLFNIPGRVEAVSIAIIFFALMTWSISRKRMPFVRLAEKVFHALDLPDPSNIDLVKSSKAQRRPDDPGEFGIFYFRY